MQQRAGPKWGETHLHSLLRARLVKDGAFILIHVVYSSTAVREHGAEPRPGRACRTLGVPALAPSSPASKTQKAIV